MMGCNHRWRQVFEETIFIGATAIGWECLECKIYVNQNNIPPTGLGGTVTKAQRLVGVHGGCGECSDGSVYQSQIYHEDGRLEIIRP